MCKRYNNYVSCDHAIMRGEESGILQLAGWVNHEREREREGSGTSWSENFTKLPILFYLSHFPSGSYITYCICIVHTKILNVTKETFCWSLRRPKREYTYIHMYACMYVCMQVCMDGCMYGSVERSRMDRGQPFGQMCKAAAPFCLSYFFQLTIIW